MSLLLEDGARIGVIGGGPAGSFFAYFALLFAERLDLELKVDIYESREFSRPGLSGCNMCGGLVSESLIQAMALEGINLPSAVVQRGIDSYVLHTRDSDVKLDTPVKEKRIAAVHRGGGPSETWAEPDGGLDGYLLDLARQRGAKVVGTCVDQVVWDKGRPQVRLGGTAQTYDLLVGATGVNSDSWFIYKNLGISGEPPKTTRAWITELDLGREATNRYFSSSVHVFLLNLPRLDVASVIPKGGFLTVSILGRRLDQRLIESFFHSAVVQDLLQSQGKYDQGICHCAPKINVGGVKRPFLDRVVLVGDCGVTRLYKDGIGTAYRTAKAAARTAVFGGVSAKDFQRHYLPVCRSINHDNLFGSFLFQVVRLIKHFPPVLRGTLGMVLREQMLPGAAKRMSSVLWDMFTGSAPYRDIFTLTMDPRFIGRLFWESVLALGIHRGKKEEI